MNSFPAGAVAKQEVVEGLALLLAGQNLSIVLTPVLLSLFSSKIHHSDFPSTFYFRGKRPSKGLTTYVSNISGCSRELKFLQASVFLYASGGKLGDQSLKFCH